MKTVISFMISALLLSTWILAASTGNEMAISMGQVLHWTLSILSFVFCPVLLVLATGEDKERLKPFNKSNARMALFCSFSATYIVCMVASGLVVLPVVYALSSVFAAVCNLTARDRYRELTK